MPIEGGLRGNLAAGTVLVARYKGKEHTAEVATGEDGKVGYRLADGRQFKSPSAAASAVMGGQAANGWRFWSLHADAPSAPTKAPKTRKAKAGTDTVQPTEAEPIIEESAVE